MGLDRLSLQVSEALATNVRLRLIHEYAGRNHVYLDDGLGVVVKRFSSGDGAARCALEVAVGTRMAGAAPVPEILAHETGPPDAWMAMRRLSGTLWQDIGRPRRRACDEALWREAGQMLARIHSIEHAPGVPMSRAPLFYRRRAEKALSNRVPHHELIVAARHELRLLDDRIGACRNDSLVHRDFSPRNLLVAGRHAMLALRSVPEDAGAAWGRSLV